MSFDDIHPSISSWMPAFEARLEAVFAGEFALLQQACLTVAGRKGKRIRPLMLMLSASAFAEVNERVLKNACLVEMVHAASLVHDDVVDEAPLRRGELSAPARWNNKFSVLLGDFILARIFEMATEDNDPRVLKMLASAATIMGRGVIQELTTLNIDADEARYLEVIDGKTAALFSASAGIGAVLGAASDVQIALMQRMGQYFGMAFQLSDDLLDLQGSEVESGKPLAIDWLQRRATLPLIYALNHADDESAAQIRAIWQSDPFTTEHFFQLSMLVKKGNGFEYGWQKVKNYLDEAILCLQEIPENPAREALLQLCQQRFPLPVLPTGLLIASNQAEG